MPSVATGLERVGVAEQADPRSVVGTLRRIERRGRRRTRPATAVQPDEQRPHLLAERQGVAEPDRREDDERHQQRLLRRPRRRLRPERRHQRPHRKGQRGGHRDEQRLRASERSTGHRGDDVEHEHAGAEQRGSPHRVDVRPRLQRQRKVGDPSVERHERRRRQAHDDRHAEADAQVAARRGSPSLAQFRARWTIVTIQMNAAMTSKGDADAAIGGRIEANGCTDEGHGTGDDPRAAGHVDVTAPADDHPPGDDHHRHGERDHHRQPDGAGDEGGAGNEAGGDPPDQPTGGGHDQPSRRASRRCSTTARRCVWSPDPTSAT